MYGSENSGVFTDARCFMDWIAGQYNMRMPSNYTEPDSCQKKIKGGVTAGIGDINDIDKDTCRGLFDYYYIQERSSNVTECPEKLQADLPTSPRPTPNCDDVDDFEGSCKAGTISGCTVDEDVWAHEIFGECAFNHTIPGTRERTWDECRLEGSEGFSYNIYQCQDERGNIGRCANNCRGVKPNSILIGGVAPLVAGFAAGQTILQGSVFTAGLAGGAIGMGAMGVTENLGGQCPNTRPCRVSSV